uniref:Uncharacterized protein n=1 Tax=Nelumbo nucifera TaxID=4432 RepID=A0A822Y6D1_NELNU|nr:TPA_asm: hypothetical protein HUJ06_028194 [Nelumbo nucifera]
MQQKYQFFHNMVNLRRKWNSIKWLKGEHETKLTSHEEIREKLQKEFSKANEVEEQVLDSDWKKVEFSKVEPSKEDELWGVLKEEEIGVVVFQMNLNKASGSNGFTTYFFEKYWEVVKDEVVKYFG